MATQTPLGEIAKSGAPWKVLVGGGTVAGTAGIVSLISGLPSEIAIPYALCIILTGVIGAMAKAFYSAITEGVLIHSREHREYKELTDSDIKELKEEKNRITLKYEAEIHRLTLRNEEILQMGEKAAAVSIGLSQLLRSGGVKSDNSTEPV